MRKFEVAKGYENEGINLPFRATKHAAGYDFEAAEDVIIPSIQGTGVQLAIGGKMLKTKPTLVKTGVKVAMENDEVLMLYNRSSNPKKGLILANGTGVLDSDYYENPGNDGHAMFAFINIGSEDYLIKKGDRIGQGVFQKFLLTDDDVEGLDRTGGWGSTNEND